jgi:hypothetical protein
MTTVSLVRYVERGDGVFAWLQVGTFSCFTVERPWLANQPQVSCIPAGSYNLSFTFSPKFNRSLWEVENVPGREGIRIHPANRFGELEGCIALGDSISRDATGWFITNSRSTVEAFHLAMQGAEKPVLAIVDAAGPETSLPPAVGLPTGPR